MTQDRILVVVIKEEEDFIVFRDEPFFLYIFYSD